MSLSSSNHAPSYIPRLHDAIRVSIPELSPNDLYTVVLSKGSPKQGKIVVTLECSQGPQHKAGNIQLIWKHGARSWTAWFVGKKYEHVQVRSA